MITLANWVHFPAGALKRFFLFITMSKPALRPTQPPVQRVPGVLSLGIKQLGHEGDHLSSCSAEVENVWSYTSTHPYVCMA